MAQFGEFIMSDCLHFLIFEKTNSAKRKNNTLVSPLSGVYMDTNTNTTHNTMSIANA